MSNIRNNLLVITFGISCWEGRRLDKKATAEVAQSHVVSSGVGRYHKDLLPDAVEHQNILKLRNAWRVFHAENTLAWGDNGERVIRSSAFLDYTTGYREYKDKFDQAVEVFCAAYPTLVAEAEFKLNTLFNPSDYPAVEDVRDKFKVRMTTYPMPNAEDFRLIEGIPEEDVERLQAEAVAGLQSQVTMAIKDLWSRLHTVVTAMQARLDVGDDGKVLKFHDSLVGNIQDLLNRVPALNLTGDAEIVSLTEEMRELVTFTPSELREIPEARSLVANKARDIAKRMACFVAD